MTGGEEAYSSGGYEFPLGISAAPWDELDPDRV